MITEPIPDYGEHMTTEEFIKCCQAGGYIDYDGSGYFASATEMYPNVPARPSEVVTPGFKAPHSHVVWFNK